MLPLLLMICCYGATRYALRYAVYAPALCYMIAIRARDI